MTKEFNRLHKEIILIRNRDIYFFASEGEQQKVYQMAQEAETLKDWQIIGHLSLSGSDLKQTAIEKIFSLVDQEPNYDDFFTLYKACETISDKVGSFLGMWMTVENIDQYVGLIYLSSINEVFEEVTNQIELVKHPSSPLTQEDRSDITKTMLLSKALRQVKTWEELGKIKNSILYLEPSTAAYQNIVDQNNLLEIFRNPNKTGLKLVIKRAQENLMESALQD